MKKKTKKNQWTPAENGEEFRNLDPSLSEELSSLSQEETQMLRAGLKQAGGDRRQLPPHDTSVRAHALRFARKNKLVGASIIVIALALVAAMILGVFGIFSLLDSILPNKSEIGRAHV